MRIQVSKEKSEWVHESSMELIRETRIMRSRRMLASVGAAEGDVIIWNATDRIHVVYKSLDTALFSRYAIKGQKIEEDIDLGGFIQKNWLLCFWLADWKLMTPKERKRYTQACVELAEDMGKPRNEHKMLAKFMTEHAASLVDSSGKLNPGAKRVEHSSAAQRNERRQRNIAFIAQYADSDKALLMQMRQEQCDIARQAFIDLSKINRRLELRTMPITERDLGVVDQVMEDLRRLVFTPWLHKRLVAVRMLESFMRNVEETPWLSKDRLRLAVFKLQELLVYEELSNLFFMFAAAYYRSNAEARTREVKYIFDAAERLHRRISRSDYVLRETEFIFTVRRGLTRFLGKGRRALENGSLQQASKLFMELMKSVNG